MSHLYLTKLTFAQGLDRCSAQGIFLSAPNEIFMGRCDSSTLMAALKNKPENAGITRALSKAAGWSLLQPRASCGESAASFIAGR